jgi:hypothetical protein
VLSSAGIAARVDVLFAGTARGQSAAALLPPGHDDVAATIEHSVGAQAHTLVTERRSIHLTG